MDYWQNNNYHSSPNETTNYISSTIEYAPPIICPTKNIYTSNTTTTTTTTTNSNVYSYKTINTNKYQTNTHYKTQNETYTNYPDEYYMNPQYIIPPTYNDIIFTNGNQDITKKNSNIIKTIENYGFHEIKETNPQFQKHQSGEIIANKNNNIYYNEYTERRTNYHQKNPLNLNNIYNINNATNMNNINNNMYLTQAIRPAANKKISKANQNQIPYNDYFINQPIISNTQTKTTTYSTYTTVKKNNNNNNMMINYNKYPLQQNIKVSNNKAISNNIISNNHIINNNNIIYEEPSDNMRNRAKYSTKTERFNNTMPNPKINQINVPSQAKTEIINKERKSYPNQIVSAFEISFSNNNKKKEYNSKNVPIKTANLSFASCINTNKNNNNNIKSVQNQFNIKNKNNQTNEKKEKNINVEYIQQIGDNPNLISGKCVDKKAIIKTNSTTNDDKNNIVNNNKSQNMSNNAVNNNKNKIIVNNNNKESTKNEKNQINNNNKQIKKQSLNYEIENKDINQTQNIVNAGGYFDTYSGKIINNQNQINQNTTNSKHTKKNNYHTINLNENQNDNYLDNSYPILGQKTDKTEILTEIERNNRFKEDIDSNDYNMDMNQQAKNMKEINNNIYKKTKSGVLNDSDVLTLEPQPKPKRRPVYKIPPSKKRSISQGRSLAFIHKYYDENFILEEDNEDNVSDSEKKRKCNQKLKTIFREVTNIRRLIPQWQKMKEENNNISSKNNDSINVNLNINNEEFNNSENTQKQINIDNLESLDGNNEQNENDNVMRLSRMGFSLERSSNVKDENKEVKEEKKEIFEPIYNNENIKIENSQKIEINEDINNKENININLEGETQFETLEEEKKDITENSESNQNTIDANNHSFIKKNSLTISQSSMSQSKEITEKLEKEKSNEINSKNSKEISQKSSLDNIDINNSLNNKNMEQSNIKNECNNDNDDINMNLNINIENEKKENDSDKRISLNIAGYDLDKYFENEGVNKRDSKQTEVSTSLRTIDLNEEYKNGQVVINEFEGEDQKDYLKNFQNENMDSSTASDYAKVEENKEGDNLVMYSDAMKANVPIHENIQNVENKNTEN